MAPDFRAQAQACGSDWVPLKSGPASVCQPISWMTRQFLNDELHYCQSFFVMFDLLLLGLFVCFLFLYEGGTLLTLSGFGFNENSKVLVGDETCIVIEGDLNKITCRTPKVRHLISVIF